MTAALADELTRHKQAYLELFKGVLAKRPMDAPAREALLSRLSAQLDTASSPDDLIPRIPEFAGMLGVGAQPLATYIGTNFLQALQIVSKRPQAPSGPSASSASQVKKSASFLAEVVQLATLAPGSKFVQHDAGFLKLVTPQGEVFSQSFLASGESGGVVQINFEAPTAAPESPVQPATAAPGAPGAPARPVQAPPSGGQEQSILREILGRFGSTLDIPGKLVPRDYGSEIDEVDLEMGEAEEEEPEQAAGTSVGTPAPRPQAAPAGPGRREHSILKEILEKFGSQLDIPGKLVPKDYGDEGMEEVDFGQEEAEESDQEQAAPVTETPVPFTFGNYMDTLKRLQDFQTSADQDGYKNWLAREATPEAKVLVAVRNFDRRLKQGQDVNWQDEYYSLALRLGSTPAYVSRVHAHLTSLGRVHSVWGSLMQKARSSPAPLMEDLKRLWPQIRLLFEEGGTQAALNSRLQMLLLAVPDPARKEAVRAVLAPHLAQLAQALQK